MFTIHASLDNPSEKIRLSSDSRYQLASEPADERWIGENPIKKQYPGKTRPDLLKYPEFKNFSSIPKEHRRAIQRIAPALGAIGDCKSIKHLGQALNDPNMSVQLRAIFALEQSI